MCLGDGGEGKVRRLSAFGLNGRDQNSPFHLIAVDSGAPHGDPSMEFFILSIQTSVRLEEHVENASVPMVVIPLPIVIFLIFSHHTKAHSPIEETELGILMLVRFLQF